MSLSFDQEPRNPHIFAIKKILLNGRYSILDDEEILPDGAKEIRHWRLGEAVSHPEYISPEAGGNRLIPIYDPSGTEVRRGIPVTLVKRNLLSR